MRDMVKFQIGWQKLILYYIVFLLAMRTPGEGEMAWLVFTGLHETGFQMLKSPQSRPHSHIPWLTKISRESKKCNTMSKVFVFWVNASQILDRETLNNNQFSIALFHHLPIIFQIPAAYFSADRKLLHIFPWHKRNLQLQISRKICFC